MKICAISDTHGQHRRLSIPECDVLVHAGDFSMKGCLDEVASFISWLAQQPAKHKVFIAGNHDFTLDKTHLGWDGIVEKFLRTRCDELGLTYLQDSEVVIDGIKFYGTPWTPYFFGWGFNGDEEDRAPRLSDIPKLSNVFSAIPEDVDVVICHGPVFGYVDRNSVDGRCGSTAMEERVKQLPNLKLHISGHIHEARGTTKDKLVHYCNVSSLGRDYKTLNDPVIINIENKAVSSIDGY